MTGSTMPERERQDSPGPSTIEVLTVTAADHEGVSVLSATGEIDISNIGQISDAISSLPGGGEGLIVDLTDVSYIDSTAVSLLHGLAMRLRQRAQRLVVVSPATSPPRRVLELTALHVIATLTQQLDEAIAMVRDDYGPGTR